MRCLVLLAAATVIHAETGVSVTSDAGENWLSVSLRGGPEVGTPFVNMAKALASDMFASAGVHVDWCVGRSACRHWEDRIVVTLEDVAPRTLSEMALADAQVFEGRHVRIFLDRVKGRVHKSLRSKLLAHVLVHEVTHLVQACDRHSATGVMKSRWDRPDYQLMAKRALGFAAEDVDLIRMGLAKRRERR